MQREFDSIYFKLFCLGRKNMFQIIFTKKGYVVSAVYSNAESAKLAREIAEMGMVNKFDTVRVIDMDDIEVLG